jgi:hypothetical protein
MTTGNTLYLLMCLAMFGGLSATLAFYSSGKSNPSPRQQPEATVLPDAKSTVTN